MNLIDYIYKENGVKKTRKNVATLALAPWIIFIYSLLANFISGYAHKFGVGAQFASIPVVAIGCALFSIYNVALYFFKWWHVYQKDSRYRNTEGGHGNSR